MAKKRLIDLTDEELARQEEEQNLAEIEESIDSVILYNKNCIADLNKQISEFYVGNPEDLDDKLYLMESRNSHRNKVENWEGYKDSPYFGRMDLVRNGKETESFFVGEKGIADGDRIFVLDWRTPVGSAFANKQATRYTINGNDYKLILRRAVDVKRARLIGVHTEYDDGSLSLDGEVIDPFLLSVLRDKRRNYKLTDIIRTIQGNQNELIRKPIEESFIVQGCAGSGKTMILLHRLSYIAFNFPDFNFSRCCILTPNEYFNIHVDELSQKLGLDKIKRYTVEGFYASWIRYLGRNDTYTTDTAKRRTVMKAEPVPDSVSSEKLLNSEMLAEVYSRDFYDHITALYNDHWKRTLDRLEATGIKTILTENGKAIPDQITYGFSAYSALKKSITDIINAHSAAIMAHEKAKTDLEAAEKQISSRKQALDSILPTLKSTRDVFVSELTEAEEQYSASVQAKKDAQAEATQIINNAKADKEAKFAELKNIEDSLSKIRTGRDSLKQISALRASDSEIAIGIIDKCQNEIAALEEAENQYKSVPFYNFGKRSRARADLDNALEAFSQAVDGVAAEYDAEYTTMLDKLRRDITDLDSVISNANRTLASSGEDTVTERKLISVKKCKDLFDLEEYPDIENKLKPIELDDLTDSRKPYLILCRNKRENESALHYAERQRDESAGIIEKNEESIIPPETIETLKNAMSLVDQLDYSSLNALIESELKSVYEKYGQKMRKGTYYRHGLLYKLLLCSLYYEYKTDTPYFINVDEAQDLAETEYILLRSILGPKTTFNLYGDVNQLVYSYKGITQWDDLADVITPNLYFLNENYRNTLQITDYCNKKFEADVFGIGLSGEDVRTLSFEDAMAELLHTRQAMPGCRAAIIYRKGLNSVSEALADYKNVVIFDHVDEKKISVITVEESKGLEFDVVVVIDSQMTMNEQYISYTRALDNLIITELPGSEIEKEDGDETSDIEEPVNEPAEEIGSGTVEQANDLPDADQDNTDEEKAELTNETVNVRLVDSVPYVNAFFDTDAASKTLFRRLTDSISAITPDIMIRVSAQYIGFAKTNEKCRVYVAMDNDKPYIKFKHLFAKEDFAADRFDHFLKAYHQCCQYIEKYPESIQMKK